MDEIAECPTNRRANLRDDEGQNMFGGKTSLDFDYTMVANTQGARLDRHTRMGYITRPDAYPTWNLPPLHPPNGMPIRSMSGLAIFVEESTRHFNQENADGLWSNGDQFETRHKGACNVAYIEGHADSFRPIMGDVERLHERGDLDANDLYVRVANRWIRLELRSGELHPYQPVEKRVARVSNPCPHGPEARATDRRRRFSTRCYGWINSPEQSIAP